MDPMFPIIANLCEIRFMAGQKSRRERVEAFIAHEDTEEWQNSDFRFPTSIHLHLYIYTASNLYIYMDKTKWTWKVACLC